MRRSSARPTTFTTLIEAGRQPELLRPRPCPALLSRFFFRYGESSLFIRPGDSPTKDEMASKVRESSGCSWVETARAAASDPLLASPDENCLNYLSLLFRGRKKPRARPTNRRDERTVEDINLYLLPPSSPPPLSPPVAPPPSPPLSLPSFIALLISGLARGKSGSKAHPVVVCGRGAERREGGRKRGFRRPPRLASPRGGEPRGGRGPEERARGWRPSFFANIHSACLQDVSASPLSLNFHAFHDVFIVHPFKITAWLICSGHMVESETGNATPSNSRRRKNASMTAATYETDFFQIEWVLPLSWMASNWKSTAGRRSAHYAV